ncbi:DNA starvation/stationary phase protection protein [Companilactobacillus sp. RD055328]|uniref:DNA starvation/stationary phase protection protein n=1 Tax=Companilactobacillus sp. RD055328 TaxID=2916634 RepID=UPI001FC88B4E|nr:DNA starvation/stationary phase protection protein [Companilactobacillus sp. RD055328]GKQ42792.1 DNA starvation/stationary phase protection protein [Companilactobacillus sp. RD055328]
MMNPEELYQQELKQSEIDHKTPTAGAMSGHIISNLQILEQKIQQVKWYYVGDNKISLQNHLQDFLNDTLKFKDQLGEVLLDELEFVPSVSDEFQEFTMLKEDSKYKYNEGTKMINMLADDIQTNMMFITRAIKLAQKEDLYSLQKVLISILEYSQHEFRVLKAQTDTSIVRIKAELEEDED